jgi:hypothetical protein
MSTAERLRESAQAFHDVVWPCMSGLLGGGTLLPNETKDTPEARVLDMFAMTDAWQVLDNGGGVRALASRVIWKTSCQQAHTVRALRTDGHDTELQRLMRGDPTMHEPGLFIHANVDKSCGLCVCAGAVTGDALRAGLRHAQTMGYPTRVNPEDGNEFYVLAWSKIAALGYDVITYTAADKRTPRGWQGVLPI